MKGIVLLLTVLAPQATTTALIQLAGHFGAGRSEKIRFADATITSVQAESLARKATEEEHAEIEKLASQDGKQATVTREKE